MLHTELDGLENRHKTMIDFFKGLGAYAPTMGMVGTVIGLINMLQNLSDPAQLGIGMSVAMLTTLYGVIFANLIYLPVGAKLERLHNAEMETRELVVEVSADGRNWRPAGSVGHEVPDREEGIFLADLVAPLDGSPVRAIRFQAVNYGPMPEWHLGAGGQGFIFVDELIVR